ncbi:DHA2 family efflux MFS transporter permease subunit [Denitratisoma oestradiolicum]|uniref:Multidrug export protein EmrB n=1 Tax=Denitratisoma oestradiolicum TaxID=311182 RepID=A0A6S6XSE7_9PROT|nr:DHA2 family efflux MFS transporter permease subunit [Denitratisoma oestradiolicum]TWO80573.1 hypothetical protein CBW56_09040 [Denitratisoma oestradiolicum]CAB1367645.1 Multidrug export protein EmrB [Denitratisoma oestradiolicum]
MAAVHTPHPPIEGSDRLLGTIAVSLAIFMYGLDMAVANVSIPTITGNLGVSINQGTWVITSYAVANAIVIPLTGWLTARFGQVRLFVASTLLFTLTSVLCGLSTSLEMLVFFRCLQGAVAGPMNPLAMALLLAAYPPQKAAFAMGASMMTAMMSPALGPVLGGWITDNFSWPWIFYINIPVGLFSAWVSWRIFRNRESVCVKQPVDYVGLLLLMIWVGAFQVMMEQGREHGWFDSPWVVFLGLTTLIGFLFFLVWEWYEAHPMVELRLFKISTFSISATIGVFTSLPFFGNIVLTPLWLQSSLGYNATQAGQVAMVSGLFMFLFQPLVARALPHVGNRRLAVTGLCILILSVYLRTGFTPSLTSGDIFLPMALQGIGAGAVFMPIALLYISAMPPAKIASANGIYSFTRTLSIGIGTSLATSLWDERTSHHHAQLSTHISPYNETAVQTLKEMGTAVGNEGALTAMERLITVQAQTLAVNDYNVFAIGLLLAGIAFILLVKPGKPTATTAPAPILEH